MMLLPGLDRVVGLLAAMDVADIDKRLLAAYRENKLPSRAMQQWLQDLCPRYGHKRASLYTALNAAVEADVESVARGTDALAAFLAAL